MKVVMMGDGGVGKSAITLQFLQREFMTEYDPTIEDLYTQHIKVDGQWCILDVLDTAGQEEYSPMRQQQVRYGDGFMLVYSVTDESSFRRLEYYHDQILRTKGRDWLPMVICGNKADVCGARRVSAEEGAALGSLLRAPHLETSAKDPPLNIDRAFHELVRVVRAQPPAPRARLPRTLRRDRLCALL